MAGGLHIAHRGRRRMRARNDWARADCHGHRRLDGDGGLYPTRAASPRKERAFADYLAGGAFGRIAEHDVLFVAANPNAVAPHGARGWTCTLVANPDGWRTRRLGSVLGSIRGGLGRGWRSVLVVVGLAVARALIAHGIRSGRLGGRIGDRVMRAVQRWSAPVNTDLQLGGDNTPATNPGHRTKQDKE